MNYTIMMYCPAWCYCTIEASSEEELKESLMNKRYETYDEDIGEPEQFFLLSIDDEDLSVGEFPDRHYPEVFLSSSEKE